MSEKSSTTRAPAAFDFVIPSARDPRRFSTLEANSPEAPVTRVNDPLLLDFNSLVSLILLETCLPNS